MKIRLNTIKNINNTNLNQNDKVKNSTKQSQNLSVEDNVYTCSKEASSALKNNITFGRALPNRWKNNRGHIPPRRNNFRIVANNNRLFEQIVLTVLQRNRFAIDGLRIAGYLSDNQAQLRQNISLISNNLDTENNLNNPETEEKTRFAACLLVHRLCFQNNDDDLKIPEHFLTPSFMNNKFEYFEIGEEQLIKITNPNGGYLENIRIGTKEEEIGNVDNIIFEVKTGLIAIYPKDGETLTNINVKLEDGRNSRVENINVLQTFLGGFSIDEANSDTFYINFDCRQSPGNYTQPVFINNIRYNDRVPELMLKADGSVINTTTGEIFDNGGII